jgi:cell division transport system ATP-binding protein
VSALQAVVQLANVSKAFSTGQFGLQQIDLKINGGEFLFIAGASGAGKSTLLKLLYGAEQVTSGSISILGNKLCSKSATQFERERLHLRRDLSVIFQDYKLLERRTVLENVAVALEVRECVLSERLRLAKDILETLGLKDKISAFPCTLSGGEQQRVAIARALIHQPKILLADEPTGSLDRLMTSVVFDLLQEANQLGVTVVVATHNLSMIEELNRRTVVLDKGRIIGDFGGA